MAFSCSDKVWQPLPIKGLHALKVHFCIALLSMYMNATRNNDYGIRLKARCNCVVHYLLVKLGQLFNVHPHSIVRIGVFDYLKKASLLGTV